MTLRHLRIFVTVVKNNSITKAAKELYLSQPAVSQAIKELEENYQIKLFSRINKKLYITDAGTKLYNYALNILEMYKNMEDDLLNHNYSEKLRIGAGITIAKTSLFELLDKINNYAEIEVNVNNSATILSMLEDNLIDIAFIEGKFKNDNLEFHKIGEDQFEFICAKTSNLNGKTIEVKELVNHPFIVREEGSSQKEIIKSITNLHDISFNIGVQSISNELLLEFVKRNYGISLISKALVNDEVASFKVKNLNISREISYVIHPNRFKSDILIKCINYLNQNYQG